LLVKFWGAKMSPVPVRESYSIVKERREASERQSLPKFWGYLEMALSFYLLWELITDSNCGAYDILTDL
jgi:hypothetical protein